MHTDKFLKIGSGHKICQDYVVNGEDYVILSDGCSMAPDTDIGARLLVKCVENGIKINNSIPYTNNHIGFEEAINLSHQLGLDASCLCATLLLLKVIEGNVYFFAAGDGSLIYKKDEKLSYKRWEYPSGAPYYLRYEDKDLNKEYISQFGDVLLEHTNEGIQKIHGDFIIDGWIENPEWVLIASDGLSSFQETKTTETTISQNMVSWLDVMKELTLFKNLNGEFLQRRCNRAMRDFKNKNWSNFDDISLAGIVL